MSYALFGVGFLVHYGSHIGGQRKHWLVPHEALIADTLLIRYLYCMKYVIDCFVDGVWVQFNVGQSVHMMSLKNKRRKVASDKISGVGVRISFILRSFRNSTIKWM